MKKISVVITSFAHEKYIAQCIESVLIQKDVDFNIIIGDDCSPDRTGDIVRQYAKKYSDIITVLPRPVNLGMVKNLKDCFDHCDAEYIAICEGDDYWIDKYKLKKMSDALDKKQDASFCFTDITLLLEKDGRFKPHVPQDKAKLGDEISFYDLVKFDNPIGNFSCCMYRNSCLQKLPDSYFENKGNADYLLNLYMLDMGKGLFIKESCSVYRILQTGQWSSMSTKQQTKCFLAINKQIHDLFPRKHILFRKRIYYMNNLIYICKYILKEIINLYKKCNIINLKLFN